MSVAAREAWLKRFEEHVRDALDTPKWLRGRQVAISDEGSAISVRWTRTASIMEIDGDVPGNVDPEYAAEAVARSLKETV